MLLVISHLSRHLWSRIFLFFLSFFFLCQAELFTPIRNCSVNTELMDRMNVEASALKCTASLPFFLLQDPTTPSTDTLEYWMTCVFQSFHHLSGCGVPFSFRCVRKSSTPLPLVSQAEERPVSLREFLLAYALTFSEFEMQIPSFPFFVQSMSLNIDMKMTRSVHFSASMFRFRKSVWIILKNLQCRKSRENIPTRIQLLLHRFTAILCNKGTF